MQPPGDAAAGMRVTAESGDAVAEARVRLLVAELVAAGSEYDWAEVSRRASRLLPPARHPRLNTGEVHCSPSRAVSW